MNIICMSGGLGNQMFQYALYLKYKSLGIETKIEDWTEYVGRDNARPLFLKTAFGIDYPRVTLKEYHRYTDSFPGLFSKIKRKIRGRHSTEYIEVSCNFDPEILKKNDTYVRGCFQSERYFKDIEEIVRKEYTFTDEVASKAAKVLIESGLSEEEARFRSQVPYTSIHIRRGDYLTLPENYGNICTEEYYDRAIKHILSVEPHTVFLVFSNDQEWALLWAQKYLKQGIEMIVVTGTDEDTGYIDMFIQTGCKHNIIANSSFSWWGAYLNQNDNRVVIAPSKWANHIDQRDIYSEWMTMV